MAGLSLLAKTDADPCPRVEITIDGLHATEESTITVWRTAGGQRLKVRGLDEKVVTDSDFVVDYEVPLGRVVDYELEVDGPTIPATLTGSVTVASDYAWLQDPLSPVASTPLATAGSTGSVIRSTALTTLTYPLPVEVARVLGATYPVARAGSAGAASRVPFDVLCHTAEATSAVRNILTTAFPVLLRPLPLMAPIPPVAFLAVSDPVEQPVNTYIGGTLTRWVLTGDLVAGPGINIVVPIWTYGDVSALWALYSDPTATGRTYLDMLKDPEP